MTTRKEKYKAMSWCISHGILVDKFCLEYIPLNEIKRLTKKYNVRVLTRSFIGNLK